MSCFVMNPESLAALANTVEMLLNCVNSGGLYLSRSLYAALKDCRNSGGYSAEAIYRKLYAVNVAAYNGRYPEDICEEPEAPKLDMSKYVFHKKTRYRDHGVVVAPWHYHLAKLLDCWLYQTAEDATGDDPFRLAMEKFADALYTFIVTHNPQYQSVTWGEIPPCHGGKKAKSTAKEIKEM